MTTFQLLAPGLAGMTQATSVLDLWTLPSPDAPVSFAAPGVPPASDELPVWRVDLEADAGQAGRQLEAGLSQVARATEGLGAARSRLATLADGAGPASFAAGAETPLAELSALRALEELRARPAAVSFGVVEEARAGVGEAERAFAAVLQRMSQAVAYSAVVETRAAGQFTAQTIVSWSADMRTRWAAAPAPEQASLHGRSVRLALASRAALVRVFLLAAQGAVRLSTLVALPGGALVALPVAWKFVNQVLAEVGQYQTLQQNPQGA